MSVRYIVGCILLVFSVFSNGEPDKTSVAVFAGGCFWCMEPPFDKLDGVLSTTSGYIGGAASKAHYKAVSSGKTQHVEAVQVKYDPSKISYETLLDVFWRNVDPFDGKGQFCDKGPHYLSYIYVGSDKERQLAEASLAQLIERFDEKVATQILPLSKFFPAENYHQNYYQRNPLRYKYYRSRCGRDKRLEEVWGVIKTK